MSNPSKTKSQKNIPKNVLVLVAMYGHLDDSRNTIELEGKTKQYIPSFIEYIETNKSTIIASVFCGGLTRKDYPIEESVEVLNYIYENEELNLKTEDLNVFVESESQNMPEQIVFGILKMRVFLPEIEKIVFVCDTARSEKAQKLLQVLLSDTRYEFETVSFDRADEESNINPAKIIESIQPAIEQLNLLKPYFDAQLSKLS